MVNHFRKLESAIPLSPWYELEEGYLKKGGERSLLRPNRIEQNSTVYCTYLVNKHTAFF